MAEVEPVPLRDVTVCNIDISVEELNFLLKLRTVTSLDGTGSTSAKLKNCNVPLGGLAQLPLD